jgi:hypothetical protein
VAYGKVLGLYRLHIQEHNFNNNNNNNNDNNDKNNNYNNYNNSKKLLRFKLLAYTGFVNWNLALLSSAMLLVLLEVSFRIPFFCFQFLCSLTLIVYYI